MKGQGPPCTQKRAAAATLQCTERPAGFQVTCWTWAAAVTRASHQQAGACTSPTSQAVDAQQCQHCKLRLEFDMAHKIVHAASSPVSSAERGCLSDNGAQPYCQTLEQPNQPGPHHL